MNAKQHELASEGEDEKWHIGFLGSRWMDTVILGRQVRLALISHRFPPHRTVTTSALNRIRYPYTPYRDKPFTCMYTGQRYVVLYEFPFWFSSLWPAMIAAIAVHGTRFHQKEGETVQAPISSKEESLECIGRDM